MPICCKSQFTVAAVMAIIAPFAVAASAGAQSLSERSAKASAALERAAHVPTNLQGVFTFEAPPAGFDALRASDDDLQRYGLPPRPDAFRNRAGYKAWAHLVRGARTMVKPVMRQAMVQHRPMLRATLSAHADLTDIVRNAANGYSNNWSGMADVSGITGFGVASVYVMWGEWVVPVAQQSFGTCSGSTDYSSTWIGIDGFNSTDVLQVGTESDAACYGGATEPDYYVWFEWYPGNSYEVTNFSVSPGDDISAELLDTSSTVGIFYLVNETTNQYVELAYGPPAGTQLVGDSAEWIVERPSVNGQLGVLTNYVSEFMTNMVAELHNGSAVFGGGGTASNPANFITMLDGYGYPISTLFAQSPATTAFHDEGSAR